MRVEENRAAVGLKAAIGRAIWCRRRDLGMGQEELAEAIGVSQAHVSRLERGQANPTLETLGRLEEVLGIRLLACGGSDAGEFAKKG